MTPSAPSDTISIFLVGRNGSWTARAYNDDTGEHIWNSEDASSPAHALREVAEVIETYVKGPVSV